MSRKKTCLLFILGMICKPYGIHAAPVQPPAGFTQGEIKFSQETLATIQNTPASAISAAQQASEKTITHGTTEATKLINHIETSSNRVIHTTTKELSEIIKQASGEVAHNLQVTHEQTTNTVLRIALIVAGVACAYSGLQDISNSITSPHVSALLKQGGLKFLIGAGTTATGYNLNDLINWVRTGKERAHH